MATLAAAQQGECKSGDQPTAATDNALESSPTKSSFRFEGEDYTTGCVVRDTVLADKDVVFAGLAVEPDGSVLTVQSARGTTPREALVRSIGRTTHSLQELQGAFQRAVEMYHHR